jgi:integrase
MRVKLTDRFVTSAKDGGAVQADYFDEITPGLALRVSSTGRKVWSFVFTSPKDGRRARLTLGLYPSMSLADARGRVIEARGLLDETPPRDPRDVVRAEAAAGMSVEALVESYLTKHVRPNRRSAAETERRFQKNVVPIIGGVRLADLHKRDINRVIDRIVARDAPVEAARTFEDLRAMLRWAVARGDIDRSPMEGMNKPAPRPPRDRVLSDDEIRTLWNGLPKALVRSQPCQRIIQLCLATGQRVGEVAEMAVGELDLAHARWTIPAARSKNGHAHTVPLSALALSIIGEAKKAAGEGAGSLFPNPKGDGPLPAAAVAKTIGRANAPDDDRPFGRFGIAHWTAHDLRRTAATGMAKLGIAPVVIGHVLNHRAITRAGVTLSIYARYGYEAEVREALERWAERLNAIASGDAAKVLPLARPRLGSQ